MTDYRSRSSRSDSARLEALNLVGLMDPAGDAEFDRLSKLAAGCVMAPICLVSLVGEDCQVFPGASGLDDSLMAERRTPISHSFCQHVVVRESPLVVSDARIHPLLSGNPSIRELGVIAYLGFPITTVDGLVLGSFCVIDHVPREWTDTETARIRDFTAIVAELLENRMARIRSRNALDVVIHDLKTPLAGVAMAAGLLQERAEDLPQPLHPLLEVLTESAAKGLDLIKSLSDLGDKPRFAGGGTICLSEVVKAQTIGLQQRALDKAIALDLSLAADLPGVAAERWVIERIVDNLVDNALKFSPFQSTIRITTSHGENWVKLEVGDQGPGFSTEDRACLFQRYAKLSAHPTGGEASTGVGLSIIKRLVDQSAGRISLRSDPGEGAVFTVLLPRVD